MFYINDLLHLVLECKAVSVEEGLEKLMNKKWSKNIMINIFTLLGYNGFEDKYNQFLSTFL